MEKCDKSNPFDTILAKRRFYDCENVMKHITGIHDHVIVFGSVERRTHKWRNDVMSIEEFQYFVENGRFTPTARRTKMGENGK